MPEGLPRDAEDFYNFGGAGTYHGAMMAKAKIRVVEVSNAMPHCHGCDNGIQESEVDYVIEGDHAPILEVTNPPIPEIDRRIAT